MFGPMFDEPMRVLGIPGTVVTAGIAFTLFTIAAVWVRRIARGDPEIKSFWATDGGSRQLNPPLIAGLLLAATAAILVIALRP